MAKHISTERKERAQKNIEEKIKVLEGYLNNGVPENAFVPRNMTQFRLWEDITAKIFKIGSPNTLDKAHNSGPKARIEVLLKELRKVKRKKERRRNEVDTLRFDNRDKDRLIRDLTDQWHASKHECDRAKQSERRLLNRVSELQRDNGELTQKLASLIALRPV